MPKSKPINANKLYYLLKANIDTDDGIAILTKHVVLCALVRAIKMCLLHNKESLILKSRIRKEMKVLKK